MRQLTKYAVCLVLTLLAALPAMAQTENAAFYIYQNDGRFNGFFYDQVQKISYSKLDTLGVEHEDYVSQEIITADSIYRIMLTAIDSVSFVQPEIKLNPNLRAMDDLGLSAYFDHIYEEGSTVKLYFKSSLPTSLYPKEGEVLMGLDEAVYGHDGYFGKVGSVAVEGSFVVCTMKPIDSWGDLFEQFITVEQVGYYSDGTTASRMAGVTDESLARRLKRVQRRAEGNKELTLISWSGRLQYDLSPLTIGVDVGLEAKLNLTYKATKEKFYVNATMSENISASPSLHLSWDYLKKEWNFNAPIAFPGIKFPAAVPLFETNPMPKGFVRVGGAVDLGLKLPTLQFPMAQSFVIDTTDDENHYIYGGLRWGDGSDEGSEKLLADKWFDPSIDFNFVINGYLQAGTKIEFTVTTNRWIENLFFASVGWEIYSGPKLEGELNLSAKGLYENGAYGLLKDTKIGFSGLSVDTEAKAKIYVRGYDEVEKTVWTDNLKFFAKDYYLFPDFGDSQVDYDEDKATIDAAVFPSRQTFWTVDVGIGIYNEKEELVAEHFRGEDYGFSQNYNEVKHTFIVDKLEPGKYNVVPVIKTCEIILPAKEKAVEVEIVGNVLKVAQTKFDLGPEAAKPETKVITTADKLDFDSNADWLSAEAANDSTIVLDVKPLEEGMLLRAGVITVTGTFKDESQQKVELTVMQSKTPGEPLMALDPDELTAGAAANSYVVRVNTNAESLTAEKSADWLTPTIAGEQLTIGVATNASLEPREGIVTVKATLNGKETTQQLKVTQQAVMALLKDKVSFGPQGGIEFCGITVGGNLPVDLSPSDDWIGASYTDGIVTVTAEPQYQANSRKGEVVVKVTVDGQAFSQTIAVEQKSYIVLDPATIAAPQAGGVFDVAVRTELTDIKIQALMKWIGLALSEDRSRLTVSVEPNTTGKARQGTGAVTAKMDDGTTLTVVVTVNQSSLALELSDEKLDFGSEVTTQKVSLTTTATMIDATPTVDWLSASVSGKVVSITSTANTTGAPRSGSVTVTATEGGEMVTKTINVTQSGLMLTLSASSLEFDVKPETAQTVTLTSTGTQFGATPSDDWIHTTISGTTLTVSVDENTTGDERTGSVEVTVTVGKETAKQTLNVKQKAEELYLLMGTSLTLKSKDNTANWMPWTNCDYLEAECSASWLTVKINKDPITIEFIPTENTSTSPRVAYVYITGYKNSATGGTPRSITAETITVTQEGAEEEVDAHQKLYGTWVSGTMTVTFGEKGSYKLVETRYGGYTQSGTYKITDWLVSVSSGGDIYGKLDETHTTSTTGKTKTNTGVGFWISADGKKLSYDNYSWTKK